MSKSCASRRVLCRLHLILVMFAGIGVPREAAACSCAGGGPPCEAFWEAPVVFAGEVIEIALNESRGERTILSSVRVRFRVERVWRGSIANEVELQTGLGGGDCGYEFIRGVRYLVYVEDRGGRLTASICTRTKLLSDAKEDLEYLETASRPAGVGRVIGQVRHRPGIDEHVARPAAGYLVTLSPPPTAPAAPSAVRRTRTGQDGRYEFTEVVPGEYSVVVVPDSTERAHGPRSVALRDARGCASADFVVVPNGRIAVRVVDRSGEPAANIDVEFIDRELMTRGGYALSASARTDGDGWARIDGLHPRQYLVGINVRRAPNPVQPFERTFYPGVSEVGIAHVIDLNYGEQVELDHFVLPTPLRKQILAGIVTWPDGSPAEGASVRLVLHPGPKAPQEPAGPPMRTSADGRLTTPALVGRTYHVSVSATRADGSRWSAKTTEFEVTSDMPPMVLRLERVQPR